MPRRLVLCLVFFVTSPALAADVVSAKPELSGAWTAVAAQRDGASATDLVGHRIEFDGDRFRIFKADTVLFGGRFTADPAKIPPEIDFMIDEGDAKGQTWLGIFKIGIGMLAICDNAPDRTAPRPRGFAAPKSLGYVCLEFER
jgi:uncharacterized protein (TIGR03067 family)